MNELVPGAEGLPKRPSSDLSILSGQLLRALETLERGEDAEPGLRAHLEHAQALAWRGVADGRLELPRAVLDALLPAQPIVDRWRRGAALTPQAEAAREVQATIDALYTAEDALETRKIEARLGSEDKSRSERAVLRVLAGETRYLRRGEVVQRLGLRLTPARVGQILVALYHDGLLLRRFDSAQGRAETAFYALAPTGVELCRRLGLDQTEAAVAVAASDDTWARQLTVDSFAAPDDELGAGRAAITVFGAVQGGLGRSTALAYCAGILAERPDAGRVLAVDLDPPGLDACLAPEAAAGCRGFAGLFEDYLATATDRRADWLAEAVAEERYVVRPEPRLPNLFYMPAGPRFGVAAPGRSSPGFGPSFLADLRAALPRVYARTFIDAPSKRQSLAHPGALDLAGALVVFVSPDSDAPSLRLLLTSFLRRAEPKRAAVAFAFAREPVGVGADTWLARGLLQGALPAGRRFRATSIARLANVERRLLPCEPYPTHGPWAQAHAGLLALLGHADPNLEALEKRIAAALAVTQDARRPFWARRVATGLITSCPDERLLYVLGRLEGRRATPPEQSQLLVDNWLATHERAGAAAGT